jgi:hypothetical protein
MSQRTNYAMKMYTFKSYLFIDGKKFPQKNMWVTENVILVRLYSIGKHEKKCTSYNNKTYFEFKLAIYNLIRNIRTILMTLIIKFNLGIKLNYDNNRPNIQ